MGVFSILLVLITLLNLVLNKRIKNIIVVQTAITIIVTCFINAGYFFASDIINIDQYQGAFILEFLVIIICLGARKRKISFSKPFLYYLAALFASFFLLIVFPSNTVNVTGAGHRFEYYMAGVEPWSHPTFSKFAIFFFALGLLLAFYYLVVFELYSYDDWKKTVRIISKFGKFLGCIIIIEILIKYVMHSELYNELMRIMFGTGTSMVSGIKERGSFIVLQGMTREASHFVVSSIFLIICFFTDMKISESKSIKRSNKVWIMLFIIFIMMSGGFSMVAAIMVLGLFYLTYVMKSGDSKVSVKRLYTLLFLIFALVVGLYLVLSNEYLNSRLTEVFDLIGTFGSKTEAYLGSKAYLTSSETRLYSTYYTFFQWLKRPLFGFGEGTTECYSSMTTLAEIGLIGVVTMIAFFLSSVNKYDVKRNDLLHFLLIYIALSLLVSVNVRMYLNVEPIIVIACFISLFGKNTKMGR